MPLKTTFGYEKKITMEMLHQYYGMCFSEEYFIGFVDGIKKIYPTYQKNVESVKNISEDIMFAMYRQGFTYHQIVESGVETEDNVYNYFWEIQDHIIENGKDYFFQRAIAQGYYELLAKKPKNKNSAEPIMNVRYMVNLAIKAVKYKIGQEGGRVYDDTYKLVSRMVQLMRKAKDNHRDETKNITFDDLIYKFYDDIDHDKLKHQFVKEYENSRRY